MFLLIVIYIVFISLGLPDSLFGVVWPVVHREFGVVESFASVYSVIVAMTSGGVSFFAGRLIRKFGTGRVTFVSVLLTAVGLLGTSFAPNLWVMMFFSVVMGYGAGAIDTGLNNYVSLHYKASHMNWLHCCWGVGVTVSPIIMSAFLSGETGSWRTGYRIIAAIQFCIALIAAISLPHWKDSESGRATAGDENEKNKKANIFAVKGVLTSTLSLGLYCGMEFLIGTWGASYLVNTFALSPNSAAKWISLYYGGIMLGRLVSGFVSMKTSDKYIDKSGDCHILCGDAPADLADRDSGLFRAAAYRLWLRSDISECSAQCSRQIRKRAVGGYNRLSYGWRICVGLFDSGVLWLYRLGNYILYHALCSVGGCRRTLHGE